MNQMFEPRKASKRAGTHCSKPELGGFCLYAFPDYDSHAPGTPTVKFFSSNVNELHESTAMAILAKIKWEEIPLNGPITEAAKKFQIECSGEQAFDLFFFPRDADPSNVWCHLHGHVNGGKLTEFQAYLRRKPSDSKRKPPPKMIAISDKLGGYPDGLSRILDGISAKSFPCIAHAEMFFMGGALKIRPRSKKAVISPFKLVDENVIFKKRDGTVLKVNFDEDGDYFIEVESRIKLRPEIGCFEIACGLLVEKIKPIFK